MEISSLDHLVLTVKDIPAASRFYTNVLGMTEIKFGNGRIALKFGSQKINLHQKGHEYEPKAHAPSSGSADLCFLTQTPIRQVIEHLTDNGVQITEGPIERTGAMSKLLSVYLRDPDLNLIEISNQLPD